jgi:hypothetical protein
MKRLALALLLCACPDKKPEGYIKTLPDGGIVTRNPVPLPKPKNEKAEVEFAGTLDAGDVKGERFVFVFSKTPCDADLDVIDKQGIRPGVFSGEIFFAQGTKAHLCAVALDGQGQIIGLAAYTKNPVMLQGEGEIELKDLAMKLNAVAARPAPKGL